MKNKTILTVAVFTAILFHTATANAQTKTPVKSYTDEKFANTTVLYRESNASDTAMLNQLNDEYGMGDVVRITEAPPKPVVVKKVATPVAPVTTGSTHAVPTNLVASEDLSVVINTPANTENVETETFEAEENQAEVQQVQLQVQQVATHDFTAFKAVETEKQVKTTNHYAKSNSSNKSVKASKVVKKKTTPKRNTPKRKKSRNKSACYRF